jgi:diacylglycerol kinase family enzyme
MKHYFVINPHSFVEDQTIIEDMLVEIRGIFQAQASSDYDIYTSNFPQDSIAAIKAFIGKFPSEEAVRVYAIGGDGILLDCLNGMADFPNAELTAIPYGSANDVIRGFFGEEAKEHFRNIKELVKAPTQFIDIMRGESYYAINEFMLGVSGQAVINANKFFRSKRYKFFKKIPTTVYKISALQALAKKEVVNQEYQLEIDGKDYSGKYSHIGISNGACDGNTMLPNPYAKPNDGVLNVVLCDCRQKMKLLSSLSDYYAGKFEKYPFFKQVLCQKSIKVKSATPIRVESDGDAFMTEAVNIELLPSRIKFAVPEGLGFADYSHKAYKKS